MNEMIKLCGLWKNTSKDGKTYLAGYAGGVKILIFQNGNKEGEKDYDYHVFLAEAPKKAKKSGENPPVPASGSQTQEDGVPF